MAEPTTGSGPSGGQVGTVCLPCWVAYDPSVDATLSDHAPRKCRVRWYDDEGNDCACMCSCARGNARSGETPR